MSKIGKLPVELPDSVEVRISSDKVDVSGPNGSLSLPVEKSVTIDNSENKLTVAPKDNSKKSKSLWGTVRSNLANMVKGVTTGFYKTLEIKGVGYKGSYKNNILTLSLGFSHNIKVLVPDDIKLTEVKGNSFTFYSHSKQRLGQFITTLRSLKPPEPYKGKGIIIEGEEIIRKEGKKK
jgi:large subunit ribosomal protein L6